MSDDMWAEMEARRRERLGLPQPVRFVNKLNIGGILDRPWPSAPVEAPAQEPIPVVHPATREEQGTIVRMRDLKPTLTKLYGGKFAEAVERSPERHGCVRAPGRAVGEYLRDESLKGIKDKLARKVAREEVASSSYFEWGHKLLNMGRKGG